jgi:putative flippase GtrA
LPSSPHEVSHEASSRPGAPSRFWEWIRHHFAAIIATIVDYSVMVGAVELLHVGPVAAVPIAASAGAMTSFTLNRHFTYRAAGRSLHGQLWRYALVSGCSLGLNTLGEYLFLKLPHLHYFLARVLTSIIVSNVWNYPLMRFFVFNGGTGQAATRSHHSSPRA